MKVVAVSSQNEESNRILWVIDLKTLLLIKCELDSSTRNVGLNVGTCLEIEGKYLTRGYPYLKVERISILDEELADIKKILDYKAAYPLAVSNRGLVGHLIKVSNVIQLLRNSSRVDISANLHGFGDCIYQLIVKDERWDWFWKDELENFEKHKESIIAALNGKCSDVYLILDYEQPVSNAVLECGGLIVL